MIAAVPSDARVGLVPIARDGRRALDLVADHLTLPVLVCGSGTLLIEAAMIARNIAPGLVRDFDYLHFPWFESDLHKKTVAEARTKIFAKSYEIFGSDIDTSVLSAAKSNAQRAGVGDTIKFSQADFREVQYINKAHLVTNPPY